MPIQAIWASAPPNLLSGDQIASGMPARTGKPGRDKPGSGQRDSSAQPCARQRGGALAPA